VGATDNERHENVRHDRALCLQYCCRACFTARVALTDEVYAAFQHAQVVNFDVRTLNVAFLKHTSVTITMTAETIPTKVPTFVVISFITHSAIMYIVQILYRKNCMQSTQCCII